MRISGSIAVSALALMGLVTAGSANQLGPPKTPQTPWANAAGPAVQVHDRFADMIPVSFKQSLTSDTVTRPVDGAPPPDGSVGKLAVPGDGPLGIPEIVLAAYRNAELAMQTSAPNCAVPWHLLAGIGEVESNHAANGRTDVNGTTPTAIYGPALDGTLPGNEIIKASDGSAVRAVGPMQFLPSTWSMYAADGNVDGAKDPNNVFDAALAAAKYLCSGGLDMRNHDQSMRAVLRYNNSKSYAALVFAWSEAYKNRGAGIQAPNPPDLLAAMPWGTGSSMIVSEPVAEGDPNTPPAEENAPIPETTTDVPSDPVTTTPDAPITTEATTDGNGLRIELYVNVSGLGKVLCGIFCPSSSDPAWPNEPQPPVIITTTVTAPYPTEPPVTTTTIAPTTTVPPVTTTSPAPTTTVPPVTTTQPPVTTTESSTANPTPSSASVPPAPTQVTTAVPQPIPAPVTTTKPKPEPTTAPQSPAKPKPEQPAPVPPTTERTPAQPSVKTPGPAPKVPTQSSVAPVPPKPAQPTTTQPVPKPQQPIPAVPQVPTVPKPQQPNPAVPKPQQPNPAVPQVPAVPKPQQPNPAVPQVPAVPKPQQPAPAAPQPAKPAVPTIPSANQKPAQPPAPAQVKPVKPTLTP
ncbi:lytic transglycosylase domain-containing protein [Nocardia altamirensis]|uniref:lytic transglycosylase domain-containing protein n=1 Tax=Nocardia altamirensis TaxID=472158 RepID=UPI0009FF9028|nr:lytic murein transglycosylase [Nocardia altamirensis]